MSKVGNIYVPGIGPSDAKILIVGEAPGQDEEVKREPFVGRSGELLTRYLERNGVRRDEVYLTNLCHYRPKGNKFKNVLGSDELEEGLEELAILVKELNPNVIIALGGWPLYHLTGESGKQGPGSGITTWRGSILPGSGAYASRKVIPTYHPAYILRAWKWNPIFNFDLGRAVSDAAFPELRHPDYTSYIDPDPDDLRRLLDECFSADWISTDIETFPGGTFSCIGFCCSSDYGVCITFERPDLHHYLREMWEAETPKILQYGTYDISFMRFFYGWNIGGYYDNVGWDTYVASANLLPDYPRKLDFLCSLYTRFPYYKEERKVWKEKDDMRILWEYNIKDVIATYEIAMGQMEEMREHYA